MAIECTLGFGGNLGDPVAAFAQAVAGLAVAGARVLALSPVYRTAPWGLRDQPEFLNMAASVATDLSAPALLDLCLRLEREAGRERRERWGPRTLDIDILTYGGKSVATQGLQIPHPRITERAFVLAPLADLGAERSIAGRSVADWLADVGAEEVKRDDEATRRLAALLGPGLAVPES